MRLLLDQAIARDLARDSDLSDSDYDVLSTLTENSGRTRRASELAAQLLWSTSRLAHHLGRMERRGLIARGAYEKDGRGSTVTLTEAGLAALEAAAPPHVESVHRHFIDLLTEPEIEALAAISAKVIRHLSDPAATLAAGSALALPGDSLREEIRSIRPAGSDGAADGPTG